MDIRDLSVEFPTTRGTVRAVDAVSFAINHGQAVGVVGESGCGKSATALALLRLVPRPGRLVSGQVLLEGRDLLQLDDAALRRVRGDRVAMVFQEPMSALNPTMRVGRQVCEGLRLHRACSAGEARARALALLSELGVPDAPRLYRSFPHQISGGMRQRALLAMALICTPQLLVADEPTTALDVTLQAQVMRLLSRARQEGGMGLVLATHDLALVAQVCDRMVVLYSGQVVEQGPVEACFAAPGHPYTAGLLAVVASLASGASEGGRLASIPGTVPDPLALPSGCRFAERCSRAQQDCWRETPALLPRQGRDQGWQVRCIHPLPLTEEAPR